jgi:low affinity Fe/Cu permease
LTKRDPEHEGTFLKLADKTSEGMGKPANIIAWLIFVVTWTAAFAFVHSLDSGKFMPAWFTSPGYNFPLNLVTTVAELFIGFLVAAATNRAERALMRLITHISDQSDTIAVLEQSLAASISENTDLTRQVHVNTLVLSEIAAKLGIVTE